MSDFPRGGDVQATRKWLDKEGFVGKFVGWKADALLGKPDDFILSKFTAEEREKGEMLCGFLSIARAKPAGRDLDANVAVVEQLTKLVEQQTIMTNQQTSMAKQLNHVIGLVERKTIKKDGSRASAGEFEKFFNFSRMSPGIWLADPPNKTFRNSARALIRQHLEVMNAKRDQGLVKEVEHVQGDSRDLLRELMNLYFVGQSVELSPERPYSCKITNRDLESIAYSGKTDAVIKAIYGDIGALCWNLSLTLGNRPEIAQIAAEMCGELQSMFGKFDIKPMKYAAVLTNGVSFLFVMAHLVHGEYRWIYSDVFDRPDHIAAMIEGCFAIANEVLKMFTDKFVMSFERLQLDDADGDAGDADNDDDHAESGGGGGDNDVNSGSLSPAMDGMNRASGGATKTNASSGGSKTLKRDIGPKTSVDSQDYRYAPLTLANVDLFNKMRSSLFSF